MSNSGPAGPATIRELVGKLSRTLGSLRSKIHSWLTSAMGDHRAFTEKILLAIPWPEPTDLVDRLQKKFPSAEVIYKQVSFVKGRPSQEQLPEDIYEDVTALLTLFTLPQSPSSSPNLGLVQLISAGSDKVQDTRLFKETDVPFASASGIHGPQISEWFIMSLLTHGHSYNALYEAQKDQEWKPAAATRVHDLVGQRLGVFGYGSIGRQAARVAKAMGMDVIAYTASPRDTPEKRKDNGFIVPGTGDPDGSLPSAWYSGTDKASLHHFLGQDIDVLLVGVPLTAATRHILSAEEFEILSEKKAFVSNIARGPIIDSAALRKALEEGKLRGAALDVTDPEPLAAGDPLWQAPNIFISPHVSGNSSSYTDRAFQVFELNLERKAKGEPLINVIDRKKGY